MASLEEPKVKIGDLVECNGTRFRAVLHQQGSVFFQPAKKDGTANKRRALTRLSGYKVIPDTEPKPTIVDFYIAVRRLARVDTAIQLVEPMADDDTDPEHRKAVKATEALKGLRVVLEKQIQKVVDQELRELND